MAPCCVAPCYHSISQADTSISGASGVALSTHYAIAGRQSRVAIANKRYCVVRIDDGFRWTTVSALPMLVERHVPVAVFLSPGLLETTPEWITFDDEERGSE